MNTVETSNIFIMLLITLVQLHTESISLSGKKAIFTPLISKLREAGGGNASNLLCNNVSGTPGAANLKALMMELEMCEANIEVIFLPAI